MTDEQREIRRLRKELRELCEIAESFLERLDKTMQSEPSHQRGRAIAMLCNGLDTACDSARRFGLGESFAKIAKRKAKQP